jgi:hypothetical protein
MRHIASAVVGLLTLSSPLAGQEARATALGSTTTIPRWHVGAALEVGQPVGDFKQQVSNAVGLQAHFLLRLDRRGSTALRLQGGWLNYGHESQQVCLGATPGCRIEANVSTTNNIFSLSVGPEFSVPLGVFRLYGHGLVGVSRFSTLSALGGGILPDFVAADQNFGEAGIFWSGGGGIQMSINKHASLDFGVAYQGHGRREYLTEGGITDNPDGSLNFDVKRSAADLFAIRIGFSTALSWGTRGSAP